MEGEAHLADKADEVTGLFERLEHLRSDHRKAGGAPIRRSVGGIAGILDDAAQKIERLK